MHSARQAMSRRKPNTKRLIDRTPPSGTASRSREGTIVAHYGVAVDVRLDDGQRQSVRVKRRSGHVVGDRVRVTGERLKRLARQSLLRRRDARGGIHVVAANLQVLGIVVAPLPPTPGGFVERAIVAARAADITPFLVINKSDLAGHPQLVNELGADYPRAILRTFPISAITGDGMDALRQFFSEGFRGAFVGSTGVGKSSLLNTLCPDIDLEVGDLNPQSGLGRHTTSASTLHTIPGGGELIDTPGFRDFGLIDITSRELATHFPGFEKALETPCRFRDCHHDTEPDCSVREAVLDGSVTEARYDTYCRLLSEVRDAEDAARRRGRPLPPRPLV